MSLLGECPGGHSAHTHTMGVDPRNFLTTQGGMQEAAGRNVLRQSRDSMCQHFEKWQLILVIYSNLTLAYKGFNTPSQRSKLC